MQKITRKKVIAQLLTKTDYICSFCSVSLATEVELAAHCECHRLAIMSDEERNWQLRAPARSIESDRYSLCEAQTNLKVNKESGGHQYTEQLFEKWLNSPNLAMTDSLSALYATKLINFVALRADKELSLSVTRKNCSTDWTFRLSTKGSLRRIALLNENQRNHFKISYLKCRHSDVPEYELGPSCQEWSNPDSNYYNEENYIIKVHFATAIYGTYRQVLIFDFGSEPVLFRKLLVDAGSVTDMLKLQQARSSVISYTERWNCSDITCIPFEARPYPMGEHDKNLLACYPPPSSSKYSVTRSSLEPSLKESNYNARQHELICIEEMAQYDLLAKYNIQVIFNVADRYTLTPSLGIGAKYSVGGQLFAAIKLSSVLSGDSASGRLVLSNCNTVLIAPVSTKGDLHRKVYEAAIEDKGKFAMYIRLSKQCCEELDLHPYQTFHAEIQFQLNRLPLCEMHFAVDKLHSFSLVFPNVSTNPQLWNIPVALSLDFKLNPRQKEAVLAIIAPLANCLPPVLISGPFGTGKTYMLAQAVIMLLDQKESRILVCTHSNSAADIYIREYLHPAVAEGRSEATPLRIYYRNRWISTADPTVQQYCLIDEDEKCFRMPTIEEVKKHKVVVTTLSTAKYLVQLKLDKGYFTHILIDEAAQAKECEAIMPLSLASENTRIVLAGDHMQLNPECYSAFAKERNLNTSLLERLYDSYPENFSCKILFCENYRSHEAIIQYTSEFFYDNHLKASGIQPRHEVFFPLTFFTAKGEDVQDCSSTAFYNNAEVYEVVERVSELKRNWPEYWGVQDETSIGVVTPYYDQVVRIRAELRKRKLHGVSVERVLNVQGKQFRVIVLSTVRTLQTCNTDPDLDHGFLSSARLLNTAITRAQSLVAVVGDPVSLCSVGKCRKLWESFILKCHQGKSLFGITWDTLQSQLVKDNLFNSKKKSFNPNVFATEFVPGKKWILYKGVSLLQPPKDHWPVLGA